MFCARKAEPFECLGGDDQGVRGIEAAGDADHDLPDPDRLQPLRKPCHLDVVGLVAIEREPGRVGRDEGEALHLPLEPHIRHRRVEPERDAAERLARRKVPPAVVVEGAHPRPLLAQEVEIDVGERRPAARRKAFGLGEQHAVLENLGLAVPGEVGRRLPCPGSRIEIGGQAAGGLGLAKKPARLRLADRDVGGGEIGEHRGAGQRRLGRGRDRHPEILADLGVHHEAGDVFRGEQEVRPEGRLLPGELHRSALGAVAGGKMPALVEFAVVRQVDLGHDAEQPAAVHGKRAVIEAAEMPDRRAEEDERHQLAGRLHDVRHAALDRLEQGVLQQEVVDRVGR